MADRTGQELGNYRLTRLLGRGGFAEVYLGEHMRLKTQAAIKVLYAQLDSDNSEEFLQEAQTVAHLIHPNIVRIFDFDVREGVPFLVMDYAPSGTLRQRHPKNTRLPLETIIPYIKQVADALQYAHDEKFIHRDIKPENMLIGRRGEILLSDFGIALIAQSTRMQSTQEVVGTAYYMAPEQLQGKPRLASDQYALGVVVYEWLSGSRPFSGSFSEIASQHMFVPPTPLREKLPMLSPAIEEVVMTALAKDPHQRFASVRAFANALEQANQSHDALTFIRKTEESSAPMPSIKPPTKPVQPSAPIRSSVPPTRTVSSSNTGQSSPITPPAQSSPTPKTQPAARNRTKAASSFYTNPDYYKSSQTSQPRVQSTPPKNPVVSQSQPPRKSISRRSALIRIAGVTAVVAIGGGAIWYESFKNLPKGTTNSPEGTLFYTYQGHSSGVNAVAWSPSGQRIASASGDTTVQVWDAPNGGHVYTYTGHFSGVNAVAWSPDGQRIASAGIDNTVQVWDATNGGNVYIYKGHSGPVYSVAWSPDGQRIASAGIDNTVQVWDATNGGNVYIYKGHSGPVYSVVWSPSGQRIASASDDTTVQVWDAPNGGNIYTYMGHSGAVISVVWSPDGQRIASASTGGTVQAWDAANGGNVSTYEGNSGLLNPVNAVAWSPDGQRIASGSYDQIVQIWDAPNGGYIYTYKGHSASVNAVAWSPNGQRIASAGGDGTVQVWEGS